MGLTPFIPESIVLYVCSTYCPLLCIILDVMLIREQPHEVRGSTPSRRSRCHGLHEVNSDAGPPQRSWSPIFIRPGGHCCSKTPGKGSPRPTIYTYCAGRSTDRRTHCTGDTVHKIQAQGQRQHSRCSWRVAAETVAKGAGLDTVTVEPMVQGPPHWTDCSNFESPLLARP